MEHELVPSQSRRMHCLRKKCNYAWTIFLRAIEKIFGQETPPPLNETGPVRGPPMIELDLKSTLFEGEIGSPLRACYSLNKKE